MNQSKTEKLSATEEESREFELQKMLQDQETLNKQQDSNTDESISQCQTNCQTAEVDKFCNQKDQNEVKRTEKQYGKHKDNMDFMEDSCAEDSCAQYSFLCWIECCMEICMQFCWNWCISDE